MDFATSVVRGYYALIALVVLACCIAFFVQRFLWKRRGRLRKRRRGFYPNYTAAGNALQILQALPQPRAEYVIEEKFDDEADDDDEGDPYDAARHLNRQLRRIRRGDRLERLIVLQR